MCVIFFYVNSNPSPDGLKLIVSSNRDEFYSRETLDMARWEKFPHVFGGIDLQTGREGGSWLAVSGKNGSFKLGALLNVTGEPKPKNAEGRGMIVSDYVAGNLSAEEYNRGLLKDCEKYTAFNFVAVEMRGSTAPSITLCSNAPKALQSFVDSECYGFGNSPSGTPFKKVIAGRERFEEIVKNHLKTKNPSSSHEDLVQKCMNLLKNEEKHWPDEELATRAPNWGEHLSAINVKIPDAGYGSRTHSVILIDADDKLHFYEETMLGDTWNCNHIVEQCSHTENGSITS